MFPDFMQWHMQCIYSASATIKNSTNLKELSLYKQKTLTKPTSVNEDRETHTFQL